MKKSYILNKKIFDNLINEECFTVVDNDFFEECGFFIDSPLIKKRISIHLL